MKTRLSISKNSEEILRNIRSKFDIKANIVCRYAVTLSLGDSSKPEIISDNSGRDFNRITLTGDDDLLLRELIKIHHGDFISDDEYMTTFLKAHIERGLDMISKNISQSKSFDNFIMHLISNGELI
jgi:DNA sulfur modification protein DndE